MKLILKISAILVLLTGFQSVIPMQLNPQLMTSQDLSHTIALTKPTLNKDDEQLWQLVFKACRADTDDAARGVAINCLALLTKQGANLNSGYVVEFSAETQQHFGMPTASYTPLVFAISSKKMDLIKALLDLGAGVNVSSTMGTPIHAAVTCGNLTVIPELLARGADINAQDEWGQSPLFTVLYQENHKAFKLLYDNQNLDCTIQDNQGQTPLHFVVLRERPSRDIVRKLLARGANPHIKDRLGHSALEYARDGKYNDIVAVLEGREVENTDGFLAGTVAASQAQAKVVKKAAVLKKSRKDKKKKQEQLVNKKKAREQEDDSQVSPTKRVESGVQIETTSPTKKSRAVSPKSTVVTAQQEVISPTKEIRETLLVCSLDNPARRALPFEDEVEEIIMPLQGGSPREHEPLLVHADQIAPRVQQWFNTDFLAQEKMRAVSAAQFARSVYYHQIPLEVISCVMQHGTEQEYASNKQAQDIGTKWYLRGDMVFDDHNANPWMPGRRIQPGYYHCTMNSTGQIYHVGFDPIRDGSSSLFAHIFQTRILEFPGVTRGITHRFDI